MPDSVSLQKFITKQEKQQVKLKKIIYIKLQTYKFRNKQLL